MTGAKPRILCIDDESNVLLGLSRVLRPHYEVVMAVGARKALDILREDRRFPVVISDLRMPEMDGIALLSHIRRLDPDIVRILLTGNADLHSAIAAVNDGAIFRFLTKPCPPEVLAATLDAAMEQYHLATAQRCLLEETLHGSIKALTSLLSLSSPATFGHAVRLQRVVRELTSLMGLSNWWEMDVAAMLAPAGFLTLPPRLQDALHRGAPLTPEERDAVLRGATAAADLVRSVPRMEGVRDILLHFREPYAGPGDGPRGEDLPLGARILRVAADFDDLETQGLQPTDGLRILQGRADTYDPAVLADLATLRGEGQRTPHTSMALREVRLGMIFAEDLRTPDGTLLIGRGQEVSTWLLDRIENYWSEDTLSLTVRTMLPAP